MGFTQDHFEQDDATFEKFKPVGEHPWLMEVSINTTDPAKPSLAFWFAHRHGNWKTVSRKYDELISYRDLFEKSFADLQKPLSEQEARFRLMEEQHKEVVNFEAGPTSKIRSVLTQAGLPDDMKEAILAELERQWARTPGN